MTREKTTDQKETMTNDKYIKCPTCGQPVVSGDANGGKRRNKRGKSSGATRAKPDSVSRVQGTSDQGGYVVVSHINVAFAFRGGNYEGSARIVGVDEHGISVVFPWCGGEKKIKISKSEVVYSE